MDEFEEDNVEELSSGSKITINNRISKKNLFSYASSNGNYHSNDEFDFDNQYEDDSVLSCEDVLCNNISMEGV